MKIPNEKENSGVVSGTKTNFCLNFIKATSQTQTQTDASVPQKNIISFVFQLPIQLSTSQE